MATVNYLGRTSNSVSGTHSFTGVPTLGALIVIITIATDNVSAATCTDDNSSGTYSLINSATNGAGAHTMTIQVRNTLIPSSVSTIFSHAPGTSTGGAIIVYEVVGATLAGAAAAVQSQIQSNQAAATPAPVFGATPRLSSPIIAGIINTTNPAGLTPRSGYTENEDFGWGVPTTGYEVMHLASGETSATITWGSASATGFATVVLEVDATVTTTRTQTGVARIAITTTQTQTGISRITKTVPQTQTGISRITALTSRNQTGISRITKTTPQNQTGLANISSGLTQKTQTGLAKISATTTNTQTGVARITIITTRTLTGLSRITATTPRTQTGKSSIRATTQKPQTGKGAIIKGANRDQTGVANIQRLFTPDSPQVGVSLSQKSLRPVRTKPLIAPPRFC